MKTKVLLAVFSVVTVLCQTFWSCTELTEATELVEAQSGVVWLLGDAETKANVPTKNDKACGSVTSSYVEHTCSSSEAKQYVVEEVEEAQGLFSENVLELNYDILKDTAKIFNSVHFFRDYEYDLTPLGISFGEMLDPMIPLALSVNETGIYKDARYTWSSAMYSEDIVNSGCDIFGLNLGDVNTDFYESLGLGHYMNESHNDADSIGPLQIRSCYVQGNGITFPCGDTVKDLMNWDDNVNYVLHTQAGNFCRENNWNAGHVIQNVYEEVMLIAVLHNSGCEFIVAESGNSKISAGWDNAKSVFGYCRDLSNTDFMTVAQNFVNAWYEGVLPLAIEKGIDWELPGQASGDCILALLEMAGIDYNNYAECFGTKQEYPVRALLNYLALYKLYDFEAPVKTVFCP